MAAFEAFIGVARVLFYDYVPRNIIVNAPPGNTAQGGEATGMGIEQHLMPLTRIGHQHSGEPTGLAACFAHYGYLETRLVTTGRRSHSSLPELGHNAVESMLRVLLRLWEDPLFTREKAEIVYSIREMSSSRAGFVVPDRCETWIDLHLQPDKDPVLLQDAIRLIAANAAPFIPDLDLHLDFDFASSGYSLGMDNHLAHRLPAIYRSLGMPYRTEAFRSHSDGNLFFAAGTKPIILGPGTLEAAHTPEEHVSFSEVTTAARIYADLCLEAKGLAV